MLKSMTLCVVMLLSAIATMAQGDASAFSTKELYSTDFSTWGAYEQKADETNVTNVEWKTKYSHENLTFSIFNTQIGATNFNTGKFPDWTGGMLMCAKSNNPYVETSALDQLQRCISVMEQQAETADGSCLPREMAMQTGS